jgi:hypothetical protein
MSCSLANESLELTMTPKKKKTGCREGLNHAWETRAEDYTGYGILHLEGIGHQTYIYRRPVFNKPLGLFKLWWDPRETSHVI